MEKCIRNVYRADTVSECKQIFGKLKNVIIPKGRKHVSFLSSSGNYEAPNLRSKT